MKDTLLALGLSLFAAPAFAQNTTCGAVAPGSGHGTGDTTTGPMGNAATKNGPDTAAQKALPR